MVTMIDEIFDRQMREGREALNASISSAFSGLGRALSNAFKVLNRIEYQSPWSAKAKRARCN